MTGIKDVLVGRAVAPLSEPDAAFGVIARMQTVVRSLPTAVAVTDDVRQVTFLELAAEAAAVRVGIGAQDFLRALRSPSSTPTPPVR